MRKLFFKLKKLRKWIDQKRRKWIDQKRRKWIDPLINKFKTERINFIRFLRNLINENIGKLVKFLRFLRDIINELAFKLDKYKLEKPRRLSRWDKIQNRWNKIQNSKLFSFVQKCFFIHDCFSICLSLIELWREL